MSTTAQILARPVAVDGAVRGAFRSVSEPAPQP